MSGESTTPDLVERVRRLLEAANRLDFDAVEGFYAPDAVHRQAEAFTFEGVTAIRGFFEDATSSFEKAEHQAEEILDLGNGVTFTVVILKARLVAGSTSRVQETWNWTATWVEGMCERVVVRSDIDEARAAAERLAEKRG